jgi:hypothetical protein
VRGIPGGSDAGHGWPIPCRIFTDDVVVYFKATGTLAYEINGGSLGEAINFARVTAGLALSASDFVIV